MAHIETEKKYLIRYPDVSRVLQMAGCETWDITQTYLSDATSTRRVRSIAQGGVTRYVETAKRRISGLSSEEKEREIRCDEYESLLLQADAALRPIIKRRLRVPYAGHVLEFDLYPFWAHQAVLEIEIGSESESPRIPEWVEIIRDVSGDLTYKNVSLAARVPDEETDSD